MSSSKTNKNNKFAHDHNGNQKMLRKLLASTLIMSQVAGTAAYAEGDGKFQYRYTQDVLRIDAATPTVPDGPFAISMPAGVRESLLVWFHQPSLSIVLTDPATGGPIAGGATWELAEGTLPKGVTPVISEDSSTMTFTGMAEEVGQYAGIVYRVRSSDGTEALTKPIQFNVTPRGDMWLGTWPADDVEADAKIENVDLRVYALNMVSGKPLSEGDWRVEGTLPEGVEYHAVGNTLYFSGPAQVAGEYDDVTVHAKDFMGREASLKVSFDISTQFKAVNSDNQQRLEVGGTEQASIVTRLREREIDRPYNGGATWTRVSGTIPPGVTATPSADGSTMTYSGNPTAKGDFGNIVWKVTDTSGNSVRTYPVQFLVGIAPPLTLSSNRGDNITLSTMVEKPIYVTAKNITGGPEIPFYNWEFDRSLLPPGLFLEHASKQITIRGEATKPGRYEYKIAATDPSGAKDDITLKINVMNSVEMRQEGGLNVTLDQTTDSFEGSATLWNAATSSDFSRTDTVWEMISGTLPKGITAKVSASKSSVNYSGIPSEYGTFGNIVWRATDYNGNVYETRPLTLNVRKNEGLKLVRSGATTVRTISGMSVEPRYIRISASNFADGGIEASDWIVSGVPGGMSVSKTSSYVSITGVPTRAGTYTVKVAATDAVGQKTSGEYVIEVQNGLSAAHYNATAETLSEYGAAPKTQLYALNTAANAIYREGGLSWQRISGQLPPGVSQSLSADQSTMSFTGSPTTQGTYGDIVYRVTNSVGDTFDTKPFTFTVDPLKDLDVTTSNSEMSSAVGGYISGTVYARNLPSIDVLTNDNWSVSGLPDGVTTSLSADGKSLYFRGTPTKKGDYTATFTAVDRFGRTDTVSVGFSISAGFEIVEPSTNISGVMYSYITDVDNTLVIRNIETGEVYTGGATWEMTANALPTGVSATLSDDGSTMRIRGISTQTTNSSTWQYTRWTVTLSNGVTIDRSYSTWVYNRPLALSSPVTATTYVGTDFSRNLTVTYFGAGRPFDIDHVTHSALPAGLSLRVDGDRLYLEGKPEEFGNSTVNVTVTDAYGRSASSSFILTINAPFRASNYVSSFSTAAITAPVNRDFVTVSDVATGVPYTGDVTWSLASGSIPRGLALEEPVNGTNWMRIVGYAEQTGTFKSTWRATTPDGTSAVTPEVTITVTARTALSLSTSSTTTSATVNVAKTLGTFTPRNLAYGQPIEDSKWSVTGLPPGYSPVIENGILSIQGAATKSGSYAITVRATDASNVSATWSGTVTVNAPFRVLNNNSSFQFNKGRDAGNRVIVLVWDQGSSTYWTGPLTLTKASGTVPPGMTVILDPNSPGRIIATGTPTSTGTWKSRWKVTDPDGNSAETTSDISLVVVN